MHATQVARPFHTKGWVYEEKCDGWRIVAIKDKGRVRLVSRNERDHTKRFPHLIEALTKLKPASFTLDGEVAVFDAELVSRFEWLRHLNHGDLATPPLYMVFDMLQLGKKDYRPAPLKVRRQALEKVLRGQKLILPARRLSPNGFAAWTEVLHRGYERGRTPGGRQGHHRTPLDHHVQPLCDQPRRGGAEGRPAGGRLPGRPAGLLA